jgi:hypothetical protein
MLCVLCCFFKSPSLYVQLIAGAHDKRGVHVVPVQAVRRTDVKVNGLESYHLSTELVSSNGHQAEERDELCQCQCAVTIDVLALAL